MASNGTINPALTILTAEERAIAQAIEQMKLQRLHEDERFKQSQYSLYKVGGLWQPNPVIPRPKNPAYTLSGVHPIFVSTNFPAGHFENLFGALTLVSRFIRTECLFNYWAAVFAEVPVTVPNSEIPGATIEVLPRTADGDVLSAPAIILVQKRFDDMADFVTFQPKDLGETLGQAQFTAGPGPSPLPASGTVVISYNEARYQELARLVQKSKDATLDDNEHLLLMYNRFQMAVVLLHELAHAAQFFMFPSSVPEIAVGNQYVVEAGFDVEQSVFGGVFNCSDAGFLDCKMIQWPSSNLTEHYVKTRNVIRIQGLITDNTCLNFRVPRDFIRQLFHEEFWDQVVPVQGARALQVPQLLAWRWLAGGSVCRDCGPCAEWQKGNRYGDGSHGILPPVPKKAGCMFGYIIHYEMFKFASNEGIPAGFVLLEDGSVVAQVHEAEVRLEMQKHAGKKQLKESIRNVTRSWIDAMVKLRQGPRGSKT